MKNWIWLIIGGVAIYLLTTQKAAAQPKIAQPPIKQTVQIKGYTGLTGWEKGHG